MKSCTMNLKYILFQPKKLIDVNKFEHPTYTLAMNLLKSEGGSNMYVRFIYVP